MVLVRWRQGECSDVCGYVVIFIQLFWYFFGAIGLYWPTTYSWSKKTMGLHVFCSWQFDMTKSGSRTDSRAHSAQVPRQPKPQSEWKDMVPRNTGSKSLLKSIALISPLNAVGLGIIIINLWVFCLPYCHCRLSVPLFFIIVCSFIVQSHNITVLTLSFCAAPSMWIASVRYKPNCEADTKWAPPAHR